MCHFVLVIKWKTIHNEHLQDQQNKIHLQCGIEFTVQTVRWQRKEQLDILKQFTNGGACLADFSEKQPSLN